MNPAKRVRQYIKLSNYWQWLFITTPKSCIEKLKITAKTTSTLYSMYLGSVESMATEPAPGKGISWSGIRSSQAPTIQWQSALGQLGINSMGQLSCGLRGWRADRFETVHIHVQACALTCVKPFNLRNKTSNASLACI